MQASKPNQTNNKPTPNNTSCPLQPRSNTICLQHPRTLYKLTKLYRESAFWKMKSIYSPTAQLRFKESLLAEVLDRAAEQSQALARLSVSAFHSVSALHDTAPWDSQCAPQSRSTPQSSRSVVQIRGRPDALQAEGTPPDPIQAPGPLQAEESSATATDGTSTVHHRLVHNAVHRRSAPLPPLFLLFAGIPGLVGVPAAPVPIIVPPPRCFRTLRSPIQPGVLKHPPCFPPTL